MAVKHTEKQLEDLRKRRFHAQLRACASRRPEDSDGALGALLRGHDLLGGSPRSDGPKGSRLS